MEQKNTLLLEKLKDWLSKNHKSKEHLLAMEKWIKVVYPLADDALIIAAVSHDIERAFPLEEGEVKPERVEWDDKTYLTWHGQRSARFIESFLLNNDADPKLVEKVKDLVANHDFGGDEEKIALRDADSISFLENNADMYIDSLETGKTIDQIHNKFDIMYNRISSAKARELAKRYYNDAVQKLEAI